MSRDTHGMVIFVSKFQVRSSYGLEGEMFSGFGGKGSPTERPNELGS